MARKPLAKKSLAGTRRSTVNKRRKGLLSVIIPWMQRFGIGLAVFVGVIWLGAWFFLSDAAGKTSDWAQNKMVLASADMGFEVENILVEGRKYTDGQVILAIVNVQKGDPLFSFDPRGAKDLLERLSWVRAAHVERRLPGTVYIGLQERIPMAIWKRGEEVKLVDTTGTVIPAADPQSFNGLIALYGDKANEHAPDLVSLISAEPELQEKLVGASWVGERRWDLIFKNGVKAQMPESDLGLNLRRLAQVQEENGLLDQDITAVDMRESDRISIRTKPGQVQEYKASLKAKGDQI